MPYIPQPEREAINPVVEPLIHILTMEGKWDMGLLNYVLTSILVGMKAERYYQHSSLRAVLNDVSNEYYRRVMVPYEEGKRELNGDVY